MIRTDVDKNIYASEREKNNNNKKKHNIFMTIWMDMFYL